MRHTGGMLAEAPGPYYNLFLILIQDVTGNLLHQYLMDVKSYPCHTNYAFYFGEFFINVSMTCEIRTTIVARLPLVPYT